MLKWLAMVLLAANLAFFSWTQGWLDSVVGARALGDREPGRLAQQVKPESVVVLTPKAVAAATSAASAASTAASSGASSGFRTVAGSTCLEAGPFSSPELTAAEAALTGLLPAGAWSRVAVDVPGIWVVYMGPYRSADLRSKKEAEVRRRGLKFEAFKLPTELSAEQRKVLGSQLTPGISLGRYASLNAADAALADFAVSGIQSARVVEVLKPYAAQRLRVNNAEPALAARLTGLTGNASLGKPFAACSTPS
jgi:hypothetical protein